MLHSNQGYWPCSLDFFWKLSISLSKLENVINLVVRIRVLKRAYLITVSKYYVVTLARPEMVLNTLAYSAEAKVVAKNELYLCCQFCSFRHSPLPRMSSFHWPLCFQKISCLPTFGPIRWQFHKHFTRVTYDCRKINYLVKILFGCVLQNIFQASSLLQVG
jgi:hypothetical protein